MAWVSALRRPLHTAHGSRCELVSIWESETVMTSWSSRYLSGTNSIAEAGERTQGWQALILALQSSLKVPRHLPYLGNAQA